jgi:hypothetical protein
VRHFDGFLLLLFAHARIVDDVLFDLNGRVVAALVEGVTEDLEGDLSLVEVLDVVVGNAVNAVQLLVVEVVLNGVTMALIGGISVVRVVLHDVSAEQVCAQIVGETVYLIDTDLEVDGLTSHV